MHLCRLARRRAAKYSCNSNVATDSTRSRVNERRSARRCGPPIALFSSDRAQVSLNTSCHYSAAQSASFACAYRRRRVIASGRRWVRVSAVRVATRRAGNTGEQSVAHRRSENSVRPERHHGTGSAVPLIVVESTWAMGCEHDRLRHTPTSTLIVPLLLRGTTT